MAPVPSALPVPNFPPTAPTAPAPLPPVVLPTVPVPAPSKFSTLNDRERSKDRMESIKSITALPISGEALREWVLNLNWVLSGDAWCDASENHATDIEVTTEETKSLSKDLLSALTTAASTKHSSSTHHRSARALLKDMGGTVDGHALIKKGRGFEMFQLRIQTGFNRGLGTEAITHLKDYISASQLSLESIGAYFKRKHQLYTQVCLTDGCALGAIARAAFLLEGLQKGAYSDVLKTWVSHILLGQGKLKLASDLKDLHQAATDLLATSSFYKGNVLLAGKAGSPHARAATDTSGPAEAPPVTTPFWIASSLNVSASSKASTSTRHNISVLPSPVPAACPTTTRSIRATI